MLPTFPFTIRTLGPTNIDLMGELLDVFGEAFNEVETYSAARPSPAYTESLLSSEYFVAVVALDGDTVVGGLAAYELKKFEQERSEIYIYDLAVAESHRRRGIATALITELNGLAAARGAWVVFVQADLGDDPAIALYSRFGSPEDIVHFDIPLD